MIKSSFVDLLEEQVRLDAAVLKVGKNKPPQMLVGGWWTDQGTTPVTGPQAAQMIWGYLNQRQRSEVERGVPINVYITQGQYKYWVATGGKADTFLFRARWEHLLDLEDFEAPRCTLRELLTLMDRGEFETLQLETGGPPTALDAAGATTTLHGETLTSERVDSLVEEAGIATANSSSFSHGTSRWDVTHRGHCAVFKRHVSQSAARRATESPSAPKPKPKPPSPEFLEKPAATKPELKPPPQRKRPKYSLSVILDTMEKHDCEGCALEANKPPTALMGGEIGVALGKALLTAEDIVQLLHEARIPFDQPSVYAHTNSMWEVDPSGGSVLFVKMAE